MSTLENSTIRLLSGVPLVKGGTEVLYLTGQAALGVLTPYTKQTCTEYYFVRENRRAVQVDLTYDQCEAVNYIVFRNRSHGDKLFFAFVDEIVYINDNCTEIRFTIDPFPTYLGDTEEKDYTFIVRNTYKNPQRNSNFMADFVPPTVKKLYRRVSYWRSIPLTTGIVYYATGNSGGVGRVNIGGTGIYADVLTPNTVKGIQTDGGVIIGAYLNPHGEELSFAYTYITQPDITFNPFAGGATGKLDTGVYNKLIVNTSTTSKEFEIEDFDNPTSITFGMVCCHLPSPMYFIYPKNYRGVADNVGEGITVKCPSIPITANATYTQAQFVSDVKGAITGAAGGAISGAFMGGGYGAIAGAAMGLVGGALNAGYNALATELKPPTVLSTGEPMLTADGRLAIDFVVCGLSTSDQTDVQNYFNYYGYAVNAEWAKARINTDDEAFLQTGSEYLHGSEADAELNARIMAGIKIRKTLS